MRGNTYPLVLLAGYIILFIAAYKIYKNRQLLQEERNDILYKIRSLESTAHKIKENIKTLTEKKEFWENFFETAVSNFPVLATIVADFEAKKNEYIAFCLDKNRHLAVSTREQLRRLKEKNSALSAQVMTHQWELEHFRNFVLWINDKLSSLAEHQDEPVQNSSEGIFINQLKEQIENVLPKQESNLQYAETTPHNPQVQHEIEYGHYLALYNYLQKAGKDIDFCYQEEKLAYENIQQKEKELRQREEALFQREINLLRSEGKLFQQEELKKKEKELQKSQENLRQRDEDIRKREETFKLFLEAKISNFPILAEMVTDYQIKRDEYIAATIERIRPHAFRAAEQVRKLKKEKKVLATQALSYKWEMSAIRSAIPWIDDVVDEPIIPAGPDYKNPHYAGADDLAGYWLTVEEYQKLPTSEKYQLALDRYTKRNKSNAEIGRDYERYIGYLYEQVGFSVSYFGIEQGLEDLGRDLICKKGDITHIVQCKCWSKKKIIHEKHINQLFGTTVMYYLTTINPSGSLTDFYNYISSGHLVPTFAATTDFSETAKKFAHGLGITLQKVDLRPYPLIKCNIGRGGEKIYHLPFDQQYDHVKIDPPHEFMVMTIAEAEAKGFRRAMRWCGNH